MIPTQVMLFAVEKAEFVFGLNEFALFAFASAIVVGIISGLRWAATRRKPGEEKAKNASSE